MKLLPRVIGTTLFISTAIVSHQSLAADGAALYKSKGCVACHGPTAMGTVGPRIAGIQANYLAEQIILIRDGKRASGKSPMMAGVIKSVTDDEAKAIAEYLSKLK